jgi:hypothetical protein
MTSFLHPRIWIASPGGWNTPGPGSCIAPKAATGEAKCPLDVREGNDHDGRVEHDQELRGGDDQQSRAEAAVAAAGCGGR